MLTLVPVLLGGALAAILSESGTHEPANPWLALGGAAVLPSFAFVLARSAGKRGVRRFLEARGEAASDRALRIYFRVQLLLWATVLAAFALVLEGARLASLARAVAPFDSEALLVTWVVTCFAVWIGSAAGEQVASNGRSRTIRSELAQKARRILLPVSLGLGFELGLQLLGKVAPVRELLDMNPRARTIGLAALVIVSLALAPLVVRLLTPTHGLTEFPVELPTALAHDTRGVAFRMWDLGSPVATACVAGILPWYRTVFLTKRLLSVLEPAESAAVLRHELGHARLGHLSSLAFGAAGFLLLVDDAANSLPGLVSDDGAVLLTLAALGVSVVGFLFLSRRLEHDADVYAAEGAGNGPVMSALLKVTAANGANPDRGGFRHPSIMKRLELLILVGADRSLGRRRLSRTRWLLRAIVVAAALAFGWTSFRLVVEARRPVRERLLDAAALRLAVQDPEIALVYVDRALALGTDARALVLRARARPPGERELAAVDLREAGARNVLEHANQEDAIEHARAQLFQGGVEGTATR